MHALPRVEHHRNMVQFDTFVSWVCSSSNPETTDVNQLIECKKSRATQSKLNLIHD